MRTSFRVIGFDLSLKHRLDSVAKKRCEQTIQAEALSRNCYKTGPLWLQCRVSSKK